MNPLIQGLFKKFCESEELLAMPDSEAFELFAASLILPDELVAQTEKTNLLLETGTIGIDVATLVINGQLAWDSVDVREICSASSKIDVTLSFIQAKRSSSVSSSEILSFGDTVRKFLNNENFPGYPRLQELASALRVVFDEYATALKTPPSVAIYFVTTAPKASTVDSTVVDRVHTVNSHIVDLGFVGRVVVQVLGADDLHDAWSKKNNANEVEIQLEKQVNLPKMPGVAQAILGVISVAELLKLIQDSDRSLDERVFYDNVRGFKGVTNTVNRQIMRTLGSADRDLLPVLNNGVTVVAATYSPKPGDAVAVTGFQVVNGCQTSHCLYLSQETMGDAVNSIYVPIRLVITSDEDVATRIIRATNSQTAVQENDLVALTKFQRMLEDFYKLDQADVKLKYERRSGQFYDKDVTKTRVVTIGDQMRAISAVFLDTPHSAGRYPSSLFQEVGQSIFRDEHKLLPYVASAFAAYKVDTAFRTKSLGAVFKPARYHILMAIKYDVLGERSAPLNSSKVEDQSARLIEALKGPDQPEILRGAAKRVAGAAGGSLPSPDRLKRQHFTQELILSLTHS